MSAGAQLEVQTILFLVILRLLQVDGAMGPPVIHVGGRGGGNSFLPVVVVMVATYYCDTCVCMQTRKEYKEMR